LYCYSRRLSWDLSHNSLIALIAQKRQAGAPLLDLTISNPTEAFPDYPQHSIQCALSRVESFSYRPDAAGDEPARHSIANWYAQRGIAISPERILLTASSSEAYALLFKLFCDPGDQVIAPVPSYPLFEFLAGFESVRMVPYRLLYDGAWFIDFTSLRKRITSRTRALVVVNPNNPTGSYLKSSERDELFTIALQNRLPIISDEVFLDYSFGDDDRRVKTLIGSDSVLSFSLGGLSKSAGMPQMKLGWIVVNGPDREEKEARERLELLLDTYLSVNTPVQRALPNLLAAGSDIQRQIARRTKENLEVLDRLLEPAPAHRLHLEGGWSAILQMPKTLSEDDWMRRLIEEHNVVVQPGYFFDMSSEPHAVISLITPPEIFREGVRRMVALLDMAPANH